MNFIKIILWGNEVGRLVWDKRKNISYFIFNNSIIDQIPDIAPILAPKASRSALKPIYGDTRGIYHKLPPFLADSLPDYWGSLLFSKWVEENKIPKNIVTPLYRLTFMGKRAMGAFEFEPAADELSKVRPVDVKSLYDLSVKVFEDRFSTSITYNDDLTMQSLLQVGTSAGGRQKKAIIAINRETGEIRSGQIGGLKEHDYYILKFGDKSFPLAEIEMAYHDMAVSAGILMEESRLLPVEGVNHFITKRFDRKEGKKILLQTLAAIYPDAMSYEDLFYTCRQLGLTNGEITQLYRRLVFNVIANNTDDHIKNFSFLLEPEGRWELSPAYDMTFIFNSTVTAPDDEHVFSLRGKLRDITKEDLIEFAKQNDIKNPRKIIDEVAESLGKFSEYAEKYGIWQPYRAIIRKRVNDNLRKFDYLKDDIETDAVVLRDEAGREISDFRIFLNTRGIYVVEAIIDGQRRRRFIRKNMKEFNELQSKDVYGLTDKEKIRLVETLLCGCG